YQLPPSGLAGRSRSQSPPPGERAGRRKPLLTGMCRARRIDLLTAKVCFPWGPATPGLQSWFSHRPCGGCSPPKGCVHTPGGERKNARSEGLSSCFRPRHRASIPGPMIEARALEEDPALTVEDYLTEWLSHSRSRVRTT